MLLATLSLATLGLIQPILVDGELCHPRNLLIQYRQASDLQRLPDGIQVLRAIPEINWAVVQTPQGRLQQSRRLLEATPGIEQATLDRAAQVAYTPNDELYPTQWNMPAMKADLAWDRSLGTSSAVVAVIDTGVMMTHPDLAANIWTNSGEIPGNGIDDDNNGYVDDVHGYDFVNLDGDPTDDYGHGTGCAGIVAGVGDNSIGVSGVAPKARIMVIKCGRSDGYFFDSATVPAYIYAADNGARVFSMSYFSDHVSAAEEVALQYAASHNVVPVAAAGNDSTVYSYYPGAYECVMSVAAVDSSISKAGFSDFGTWVDVAAPGVGIPTTSADGGYTGGFTGTSAACPQVAGLAALLIGANPAVSATRVRNTIQDTATPVFQAPFGEYANYGFVNADAAMKSITGKVAPLKPAVTRWISPIGYVAPGKTLAALAYGRNLAKAQSYIDGTPLTMTGRSRDMAHFRLPETGSTIDVQVGGISTGSFQPPVAGAYVYPLIEGSTKGAYCSGGYSETLNADDRFRTVTRRSDGQIWLEATFRNVPNAGKFTLVLRRAYTDSTGFEQIQFYNWAAASYPYAGFDTISTLSGVPTSQAEMRIYIPNISQYVDFDHTMYFRMLISNASDGNELHLDQVYLRPGRHL